MRCVWPQSGYANRAACYLCTSDFGPAVDDVDRGMEILLRGTGAPVAAVHAYVDTLTSPSGTFLTSMSPNAYQTHT